MMFMVTLAHTPDNCWARAENLEKAQEWVESMDQRADDAGVTVHGSFVAPNEHLFYFFLEAEEFIAVSEFLGPPLLQDHDADIVPVNSFGEVDAMLEE